MKKTNQTSLLASFATLKGLADEKKYRSPYQILQEFIRFIIIQDSKFSFSAIEMKQLLSQHFSFQIPEAVVKTAAKKMVGISLDNGIYTVTMEQVGEDSLFEEKKKEADDNSNYIINAIVHYFKKRIPNESIKEEQVLRELIGFLIEENTESLSKYAELIGEFILKNEKEERIQKALNSIREGSILYIGLTHNINETGSISKPIKLYLGTEILFSLVGYNGAVYQQFADDFYNQVRLANSGDKIRISLLFFSEIEREVEDFFATAEAIVEGRIRRWNNKPAMKAIVDGCKTAADVLVKKSDFYTRLRVSFGVNKDPVESYYNEELFQSKMEFELYEEDDGTDEERKKKKDIWLRLISHINKLREGKTVPFELDSEYLIVTNTKGLRMLSQEQVEKIKEESKYDAICGFAVSLDRITSLLWFKLGSGFATSSLPVSLEAVLKARTVLTASIAQKVEQAFEEVKEQFRAGEVTEEEVYARVVTLKNKPQLPEELSGDDIIDIMDFSPESLSRFEEQYKTTRDSLKEKDKLIESIREANSIALQKKNDTIESQRVAIQEKDAENSRLHDELKQYKQKEAEKRRKKKKIKYNLLFVWNIFWKVGILVGVSFLIVYLQKRFDSPIWSVLSLIIGAIGAIAAFITILKGDVVKLKKRTQELNSTPEQKQSEGKEDKHDS